MEDERVQQEELKHVCRLCNKRFPSGKSLGGHMRSHVIAEARKNKLLMSSSVKKVPTFVDDHNVDVEDNNVDDDDDEDEDDIEITDRNAGNNNNNNNNSGYGLRENPKKTWRMVDSYPEKLHQNNTNNNNNNNFNNNNNTNINNNNSNNNVERVCKQCGKGFHSLKALCGHMSIHSEKERHFKEEDDDNSWTSDSIDQLYLAMESHSENNSKRQTRSSNNLSSRYAGSFNAVDSFVNNNGAGGGSSSNYSEVDQLEQEEVAMCLMMLSRDSSGSSKDWFNFGVVAESSDNNSVILEGGVSKTNNNVVVIGKAKGEILKGKIDVVVDDGHEMDNSDSGYFENGAKVLESDDSVDWFSNKRTIQDVVGVESKESFYGGGGGGKKAIKHDYFYLEKAVSNKYECWICSKSFKTHQALGGHIISHRKNGENNLNNNNSNIIKVNVKNLTKKGSVSKKVKGHKCPYCPKVFKSGQALGGHKRSHMMGSNNHHHNNNNNNNMVLHSEGRLSHIRVSTPPSSPSKTETKQPMIDLNLPAPLEEEGSGNSQFVSW